MRSDLEQKHDDTLIRCVSRNIEGFAIGIRIRQCCCYLRIADVVWTEKRRFSYMVNHVKKLTYAAGYSLSVSEVRLSLSACRFRSLSRKRQYH